MAPGAPGLTAKAAGMLEAKQGAGLTGNLIISLLNGRITGGSFQEFWKEESDLPEPKLNFRPR